MSKGRRTVRNWTRIVCPVCNGESVCYTRFGPGINDVCDMRDCEECEGMGKINIVKAKEQDYVTN